MKFIGFFEPRVCYVFHRVKKMLCAIAWSSLFQSVVIIVCSSIEAYYSVDIYM